MLRLLFCFCVLTLLVSASSTNRKLLSSDNTDDYTESGLQSFLHDLPRYNFTFQKVSNEWDPVSSNYYQSLLLLSMPFLVLGLLNVVGGIIFMTIGICCICIWPRDEYGYSKFSRYLPAVSLLTLSLIILIFAAAGIYSEFQFNDSFYEAVDTIETTIQYETNIVSDTLYAVDNYDGVGVIILPDNLSDLGDELTSVTNSTIDAVNTIIDPLETARHTIILFGFSLLGIVCVIGIIGSILLWGWTAIIVMILAILCISILWICASFNLFFSIFIADMCPEIDDYIQNDIFQADLSSYVDYFLFCTGDPEQLFSPLPQTLNASIIALELAVNNATTSGNTTLAQELQNDLDDLYDIEDLVNELLSCYSTSTSYTTTKELVCNEIFNGITIISISEIVSGFLLLLCIFLAVIGFRRWPNPRQNLEEQQPLILTNKL